jgi:cell division protein FtsL
MTTSIRRPISTSARPKKAAARPEVMRSYRAASVLSMGRADSVANGIKETVRLVTVRRDNGMRIQQQWAISFIAVVAMLALLAGLYLNITATASIAGRQIQNLEVEITANEQVNADLETRIATLMADSILEQRAQALGFEPVDRKTLQYMVVPGYFPPQAVNMVSAVTSDEALSASPEFNETLIDWVSRQIQAASVPLAESKH